MVKILLLSVFLLTTISTTAQLKGENAADCDLPDPARLRLAKASHYDLSCTLNPTHLQGDFDGDGKPDYAILVVNKATKKHGIAVVKSSATAVEILGAGGTKLRVSSGPDSYWLDDFDWMDRWHVEPKHKVTEGLGSKVAATMRGDGIVVEKSEAASALVFWNGKRWLWKQMGD